MPKLLTIGHSNHAESAFLGLLEANHVQIVVDVRSHPSSRFHPQFNRKALETSLAGAGVEYAFLGRQLGARRSERDCYRDGQARYELIVRLPLFQEGLAQVRRAAGSKRVALMCAEKDPITCHRMVLVSRQLRNGPTPIQHILGDGLLESNEQAEARLVEAAGLPGEDLFASGATLVERAYDLQADRIAYRQRAT